MSGGNKGRPITVCEGSGTVPMDILVIVEGDKEGYCQECGRLVSLVNWRLKEHRL